jgi:Fungal protein kinase
MALEIMLKSGNKFSHDLRHDLESVFYVLIWVCSHMEGPETERSDPHSLPVREWCSMNVNLRKLGLIKLSHLADFEDSILRHFTPYWNDFKPYVRQLMDAFWPTTFQKSNSMTSEKMLEILKDAITNMKDAEEQFESGVVDTSVSQSYAVLNSKRNRQGQDVAVVSKRMKTSKSPMTVLDFGIWKESVMVPESDAMRGSLSSTSFTTSL